MVANPKLSPMAAYKIRKLLLTQVDQNSLFDTVSDNSEPFLDIDQRLSTLYADSQRQLKILELEALAQCYQSRFTAMGPQSQEIQELRRQVLNILQPNSSEVADTAATPRPEPKNSFESEWLSNAQCQTSTDVVKILNRLLQISAKYIGPQIAQRTLLTAKPDDEDLNPYILQDKVLVYEGSAIPLSSYQRRTLQKWTSTYIDFCASILPNFRSLLEKDFSK